MMAPRCFVGLTVAALLAVGAPLGHGAQTTACGSDVRTIQINGAALHYVECGAGEPLVFVHGGLGSLDTFRTQAQMFASRFRVIAYSRRYHPPNAPPRPDEHNPLGTHVADLKALITELKATPAHVVANSYGAYISLALAVANPELVRSLVLGEPPVLPLLSRTSVGEALRQSWITQIMAPSRRAFERGDLEGGLRQFMDGICGAGCFDKLPEPARRELVEKQAPEFRTEMMTEISAYTPPLDCQALGNLRRPTLLVTGERSHPVFLLITAELERCLEDETHVMVPGAGHSMHRENTAFYNEAVAAFLRRR
jgi:non-heme chloroperoxidase